MTSEMKMPNGLLLYEVMKGQQKSHDYINLLKTKAILIIKTNCRENFIFQQDFMSQEHDMISLINLESVFWIGHRVFQTLISWKTYGIFFQMMLTPKATLKILEILS